MHPTPYVTSDSLAYVMHARVRLLAMRPHVTRHGLPQVRGVCCLCHLALPMYACRRLNLPRSHLARLNLAYITPGSARCYADRPSPLSPHLLNRRGAQSAAICAPSAPLPTDLTRHAALQRRRRCFAAELLQRSRPLRRRAVLTTTPHLRRGAASAATPSRCAAAPPSLRGQARPLPATPPTPASAPRRRCHDHSPHAPPPYLLLIGGTRSDRGTSVPS